MGRESYVFTNVTTVIRYTIFRQRFETGLATYASGENCYHPLSKGHNASEKRIALISKWLILNHLALVQGFEPQFKESKSRVLPLDETRLSTAHNTLDAG